MYKPPGAYIWRGDLMEDFFPYEFAGLIHGGAYFQNFSVALQTPGVLPYHLLAILVCIVCALSLEEARIFYFSLILEQARFVSS